MSDEIMPVEPARPSSNVIQNQIDRLITGTLPASVRVNNDGTSEQLPTASNEMSTSAQVAPPPSIEELSAQVERHQGRINQIREQLAQQVFSRTTGQPEGHRVTGAAREQLEREMAHRWNEIGYTMQLLESTSAARVEYAKQKAAQAASSDAAPSLDAMSDAARREQAIAELAEMPGPNGKPVGRVAAAREYDAAQLRAKADKLARGK